LNLKSLEPKSTIQNESESPFKIKKGTFTIFTERSKLDRELVLLQKYGPGYDKTFNPNSQREMFNKLMESFQMSRQKIPKSNMSMMKKMQVIFHFNKESLFE
jgi:hypothetical protein